MGWSIGYDTNWRRDVGYGVPATCDYPGCGSSIDRGLSYVCGSQPYGGEHGCGLYFCEQHLGYRKFKRDGTVQLCERCSKRSKQGPFDPTPDVAEWIQWKLTDQSWAAWRKENPDQVSALAARIVELGA